MKIKHIILVATVYFLGSTLSSAQISQEVECTDTSDYCIDVGGAPQWLWRDNDGDGIGSEGSGGQCHPEGPVPAGFSASCGDCNDNNSSIGGPTAWYLDNDGDGFGGNISVTQCSSPGSNYVTNTNDCNDNDPSVGAMRTWYRDLDNDGFGDPNDTTSSCNQPSGYVGNNDDCNDNDSNIQTYIFYADTDGDGFGDPDNTTSGCTPPTGFITNNDDCNDGNENIHPNTVWYPDTDGDGFGDHTQTPITQCEQPVGYATGEPDCDDNNPAINPQTIWYIDTNGDGVADNTNDILIQCEQPAGYVMDLPPVDPIPEEPAPSYDGLDINDLSVTHTVEPLIEVTTITALEALAPNQKLENKTYYDGMGRSIQGIQMHQGGFGEDIITHIEYDRFGRITKSYMPYGKKVIASQSGGFQTDIRNEQVTFYSTANIHNSFVHTNDPYSETVFDRSPRNRPARQGSPGNSWKIGSGNEMYYDYEINSNATSSVRKFSVNLSSSLYPSLGGGGEFGTFYPEGELTIRIVKDENWVSGVDHTYEQYTNKEGQVVLKREFVEGTTLSTYYVYDDYNNLTYILPPSAEPHSNTITTEALNQFCYQYRYDHLRRQIARRIPGKQGWDRIIYDDEDRPIMVQDPKLAQDGKWLFTKYDKYGRVLYTGIYDSSFASREAMQETSDNWRSTATTHNEARGTSSIGGVTIGYTNNAYPTSDIELLTVTYYDDYEFLDPDKPTTPSSILGETVTDNVRGLTVANWSHTIGENTWSKSYSYYDQWGEIIKAIDKNHLGGESMIESRYDFRGKQLESVSAHSRTSTDVPIQITKTFAYDQAERPLWQKQRIDSGEEKIINGFVYDAIGNSNVKYIEPQTDQFGYEYVLSFTESSRSKFDGGIEGKWQTDRNSSVQLNVSKGQLRATLYNQNDVIYGYYALDAGKPYTISADIDLSQFSETLEFRIEYQGNVQQSQTVSGSGIFVTEFIPDASGTYTLAFAMTSDNASRQAQTLYLDNIITQTGLISSNFEIELMDINALQQIDYKYNSRGLLTHINDPTNLGNDVFGYQMYYDQLLFIDAFSEHRAQYNGNIAQIVWKTVNDNSTRSYKYHYDALNRLTKAEFTDANYDLDNVSYDKNGNILTLSRKLYQGGHHNFDYIYTGNQLSSVNADTSDNGVESRNYIYDENGNLISDVSKGIFSIEYNFLDLPETVLFDSGALIEFDYDANGIKLQKRFIVPGTLTEPEGSTTTTDYLGGFQYTNTVLEFFPQSEGYIVPQEDLSGNIDYAYIYNYTDHLGNIRVSYNDLDDDGSISASEIVRENNYYPFGLLHQESDNVIHPLASAFKYGYGGKELQEEQAIGWLDFGSRNYDAELGRWFNIDPQAERYDDMSPYAAMGNNPIFYSDPNGEELLSAILVGAAIGAATAAVTYSVPALITNNWNIGDFGTSVLAGAISGAITAGISSGAASLSSSAITNGGTGAFWQSSTFNILSETASQVGTGLALGDEITPGTILGSVAGGLIGGKLPAWKGVKGGFWANALGEIGFNAAKGSVKGAVSGGVGAAVDGENIGRGTGRGAINGAIGAATQTLAFIATVGATYNPPDEKLKYVYNMEDATGVNANRVAWRKGGLYQFLQPRFSKLFYRGPDKNNIPLNKFRREITLGNNVAVFDDTSANTFGHEFGHIIQVDRQGWGNFLGRGTYEQLFFKGNPYITPGTNEYDAEKLFNLYKN